MDSSARDPNIDGLRGFAALYVVLSHFRDMFHLPGIIHAGLGSSYAAVCLFFVLSGYLVFATLERHRGRGGDWIKRFYLSRAFRILPLWWLSLGLTHLLTPIKLPSLLLNATLLSGFVSFMPEWFPISVAWTLFVEEIFYLFLPLFMSALLIPRGFIICFLLALFTHYFWQAKAAAWGVPTASYYVSRHPIYCFSIFLSEY